MNKYEQLIEHIINDETDKARELFHTIVVEKSRDIYESLIDEQDLAEVGGNEVEDLVDEISIDEQGISEEDEEMGDEPALDSDEPMGDEEDHHADVGGEEELEDRVVDLEDALDELKAEFDALMAGDDNDEAMPGADDEMAEMHGGMHADEMGEMHGDMNYGEMEGMDHKMHGKKMHNDQMYEEDEMEGKGHKMHSKKMYEKKEDEDDLDESIVREYVEKVADHGQKSESGKEAGAHGSANVNKSSTVAGKNDMGGSSANIAKGGAEVAPDGTSPKAAVKPKGQLINDPLNKPGAKAGQAYAKKESAVNKEEGAVNKTTPIAK